MKIKGCNSADETIESINRIYQWDRSW